MTSPSKKLAMEAVTTEAAARRSPWSTLKVPSGMKSMIMAKREATKPMTMPWNQLNYALYMSPVFPVYYTVTTVSWSQKLVQNDNIHSMILDVHVFKVWCLKIPFSVEPCKPIKYHNILANDPIVQGQYAEILA